MVKLLQEMLDKSKEDGTNDRTVSAEQSWTDEKVFFSRVSWKSLARTTDNGSSQAVKGVSLRRYAKFKCYCDTTTVKTKETIETTSENIERMDALVADKSAQNTAYSQEASKLEADIAANEKAQGEATTTRGKEQEAFEKEEEDLVLEW